MSAGVAAWALLWIAVVVLFVGLLAVLREVNLLRDQVSRLTEQVSRVPDSTDAAEESRLTLPASVTAAEPRVVLSADSGCPLCRVVLARLGERAATLATPPVLLTFEPFAAWDDVPAGVQAVRDDDAWRQVSHLAPPVLMIVAPDGAVIDLVLPARESDVDRALRRWSERLWVLTSTSPAKLRPMS